MDPNDGTSAMQQGFRGHAVSIGLLRDGVPVLGVVQAVDGPDDDGDRFAWAEGHGPLTRNGEQVARESWPERLGPHDVVIVSGSADRHPAGNLACVAPARYIGVASIAYRLALAAAGEGAAAVALSQPCAWDYGAGHALLRAVGGTLLDESGAEVTYDRNGRSNTWCCFGGGPGVVRQLAGAMDGWAGVGRSGYGQAAPPRGFEPARLGPADFVHDTAVLRRAQGCLLGQIAGDALGVLVEFQDGAGVAAAYPDGGPRLLADGGPHRIAAGQPTDDSELALLLARTLVRLGRFEPEAVAAAYARWYLGWTHDEACTHAWCRPFDIGGTTAQALGAATRDAVARGGAAGALAAAASRSSQSNGALMRVSPLGIWGWRREPAEVAEAARADARPTHPHQACQESSAVLAVTIAHAIRAGSDPGQTYAWARANLAEVAVLAALEQAAAGPPPDYVRQQGWVIIALRNAFFRLLHAPSLEEAVVGTVREGGDTDTNAAICGALVGAVHGRAALPAQWRRMVLSCRPMPGYGQLGRPRPAIYWPADALVLAERLLGLPWRGRDSTANVTDP